VTERVGEVFLQVIVPVLLIGGFGYLLGRARHLDLAPITALAVSILVPGVVFDALTRADLPRALLSRLFAHVIVQLLCIGSLALVAARAVGWRGPSQAGLLLATLFSNSGNTGLPIALFAFGPAGFAIAGGWFAISTLTTHTVGILIAARARVGWRVAIRRLLALPITYAMLSGVLVNLSGWRLPSPLAKASQLLASGSITVLLLLLGLQLARLPLRAEAPGALLATAIRLLVAPPVAWVTARLVGLEGTALSVAVLQASMPTAVTAALWAMEFDARPALVSAAVILSTLGGVITLTLLLATLMRGPV
jgi:predicted permease